MAFDVGGSRAKVRPSMNVTPLVDVVLVLLIIFMVVTPLLTKRFQVQVPVKDDPAQPEPPPDITPPVVLTLDRSGALRLNQDTVPESELKARLERVMAARTDRTVFFDAHASVPYGTAVRVLDLARAGGAMNIAMLPKPLSP